MKHDIASASVSNIICLEFGSDLTTVGRAIQDVNLALKPLIGADDQLALIVIVLTEVTNNIVEHAYRNAPGQPIELCVSRCQRGVQFEIVDRGLAMPDGNIPPYKPVEIDGPVAELPEGGFGWPLIHQLASGLEYARVGGENRLRFYFSVRDSAQTD